MSVVTPRRHRGSPRSAAHHVSVVHKVVELQLRAAAGGLCGRLQRAQARKQRVRRARVQHHGRAKRHRAAACAARYPFRAALAGPQESWCRASRVPSRRLSNGNIIAATKICIVLQAHKSASPGAPATSPLPTQAAIHAGCMV